jgi:hypothetical protein
MPPTHLIKLAVGDIGDSVKPLNLSVRTKERAGIGDLLSLILDRIPAVTARGIYGDNLVSSILRSPIVVLLARHESNVGT